MTPQRRRKKPQIPEGPKVKLTGNFKKADMIRMGDEVWHRSDQRAIRMKVILSNPKAERQVLRKGSYYG